MVCVKAYASNKDSAEKDILNLVEQRFNYNEDGTLKNAYTGNMQYEYSFNDKGMLESIEKNNF